MTNEERLQEFLARARIVQDGYEKLQVKNSLMAKPIIRFPKNKAGVVGRFSLFLLRGCGAFLDTEYHDKLTK